MNSTWLVRRSIIDCGFIFKTYIWREPSWPLWHDCVVETVADGNGFDNFFGESVQCNIRAQGLHLGPSICSALLIVFTGSERATVSPVLLLRLEHSRESVHFTEYQ